MKWHKWPVLITALLLSTVTTLCTCSAQPSGGEANSTTISVVVTRGFGQELIFNKTVEIEAGTCAMDALKQVAEVGATYGGGFVDSINGVRSQYAKPGGVRQDWFFYINGILANVGALDYTLHPGDVEHWDFHHWGFHTLIPAIMGDFPEPFLHGYGGKIRPTVIGHGDGLREAAEDLDSRLAQLGVKDISIKKVDQLSPDEKESGNLLILGTMDGELMSELNELWRRLGFYAHFEDGRLVVLNSKGEVAAEYGPGSGLIQATQSLWNPKGIRACENVVWMVSGTNNAGVECALDALVNRHNEFQYACAVVIVSGEIIKVPSDKP